MVDLTEFKQQELNLNSANSVTVSEIESLCSRIVEQRNIVDEINSKLRDARDELERLESRLLHILEENGKDSYTSNVGTFSISHRTSVRVPQGDSKIEFFNYLKSRGLFDGLITINSQTLNAFYRQEFNKAVEEGRLDEFFIPGLDEPTIVKTLSIRRK